MSHATELSLTLSLCTVVFSKTQTVKLVDTLPKLRISVLRSTKKSFGIK
jgi:hypothetical protein